MQDNDIYRSLRIAAIIAKQLDQALTPSEENALSDWLVESKDNRELFDKIKDRKSFDRYKDEIKSYDASYALTLVKSRIIAFDRNNKRKRLWLPVSIAASLLILFSAYLFWNNNQSPKWITVTTAYGKMVQVQLPDSSRLWLNSGTVVQYPEKFKGHTRTIKLINGQAFFDVKHRDKPFVVHANGVNVTVLGTTFDVKSFADEKEIKVTVNSGKVGVLPLINRSTAVMLLPDEQLIVNRLTHQLVKKKVRPEDIAGWRNGKLYFDEEDFEDVLNALQRKYNVAFKVERPALYNEKITLQLDDEQLSDVLRALSFSNHFKYEQNEKLIVIR